MPVLLFRRRSDTAATVPLLSGFGMAITGIVIADSTLVQASRVPRRRNARAYLRAALLRRLRQPASAARPSPINTPVEGSGTNTI